MEAKLNTPIRDARDGTLIPAGAHVVFRVLNAEMARARRNRRQVLLAQVILRLESLTVAGTALPLVATSAQRIETPDPAAQSRDPAGNGNVAGCMRDSNVGRLPLAPNTVMVEFFDSRPDFVLKPGLRLRWRTGGVGPSTGCLEVRRAGDK